MHKILNIIVRDEKYQGLNPVTFGFENCKPSHHYGPAVRTYWLIHYVVSGRGVFKTETDEYHLSPGDMFVISPYEETYYEADKDNPWEYIWIGFTADSLPIELEKTITCPEALRIFSAMKKCSEMTNGQSAFLASKLWELFSVFLESKKSDYSYVDLMLDCIHSEYMKSITIDELSKRLSLDRRYLSKIFREKTGLSPKQYLQKYRLGIAASLMANNDKTVSVAAYSVGYTNVFAFSKIFKKHYGMSPTEYIKSKKEGAV